MVTLWDESSGVAPDVIASVLVAMATVSSICGTFGVSVQINENAVNCNTVGGAIVCRVMLGNNDGVWVALGGVDTLPDSEWHAILGSLRQWCPAGIYYYHG